MTWTKGAPTVWATSNIMERGFCSQCGGTLFLNYTDPPWHDFDKDSIGVAIGALDDPYAYTPDFHYGIEHKLHWTANDDELPRVRIDSDEELQAVGVVPTGWVD